MTKALYSLFFVAMSTSAVFAEGAPQYDLSCSGTVTSTTLDAASASANTNPEQTAPYTTKLHIDLIKKTFCQDDCGVAQPIQSVGTDDIIFLLTKGDLGQRFWMARDQGTFFKVWTVIDNSRKGESNTLKSAHGQCVPLQEAVAPAPISGYAHPAATSVSIHQSFTARPPSPPQVLGNVETGKQPNKVQISSDLSEAEVSALMDISNQRPVGRGFITRLTAMGYLHWSGASLTLTNKGRILVGGN